VSRCSDCGFDWQMGRENVSPHAATRLPRFRELILPRLTPATRSEALRARPSEDVWSPLEYLAHLRDVTEFFTERIQRVLAEDNPVLHVQFQFAELAVLRSYQSEDPVVVLGQFEDRARVLQALLSGLDESQWGRAGIGSGGDQRTVLMLARRFAHEVHHHLLDVERQVIPTT
jgi:hypothetical protein